jgi:O-antigen/teichoic acid export membrane protein
MIYWLNSPFTFIRGLLLSGHSRSVRAKKNIIASVVLKGASIGISLLLVPLTLNYISTGEYGIWLTMSTIVGWFGFFDIGMTQGLRNKFAEAKAKGDNEGAQILVSTAYAVLSIIFLGVWLLFLIVNQFLDWSSILKVSSQLQRDVSLLAVIVFTYFCLYFILRIITTVITANQQPAKAAFIDVAGQFLSLILIFVLVRTTQGSLVFLGLALCAAPLLILLIANFYFFLGPYKQFVPSFSKIRFSYARGLFSIGVIFFIIQLSGIIQYETANVIIARNFGTSEVTSYNIVHRYFGMLNMGFTIFLTPFWSASTEAFAKGDIQWIKNGIRKYTWLNLLMVFVGVGMLLGSNYFFDFWLGKGTVNIDFMLSFWGLIFFCAAMFGGKYVSLLNGISALRLQFLASLISPLLYIATVYILIHYYNMGVYAIFIGSIIANFNAIVLAPIQYHQIINKGKKGIWIK